MRTVHGALPVLTMGKIKVAQVITRLDWGGSPDIVRILSCGLDKEAFKVTLVTGATQYPSLKTSQFLDAFKEHVVVIPELRRDINLFSDAAAFFKLYNFFSDNRFDIVHTHTAKAGCLARLAASLAGVPVIIHTAHGHNFYGYFSPWFSKLIVVIERWLARRSTRLIALTELEKADYIKYNVAGHGKISVISQGLELERYLSLTHAQLAMRQSFGIKPGELLVAMIGRLEPVKGCEYFIRAAGIVAQALPQAKFIIVGEGSLRTWLQEQAGSLGLQERCIFTGWREDIPEIMSCVDVLVLPSLNEAVGIVLLEAQASGIPVVASKVGGVEEVIRDKQTGLLVGPADEHALAQAIQYLLSREDERRAMGEAGRKWVQDKFNAARMIETTAQLYRDTLKVK
jgi:glycosyltransferase involved in cell wall biosynthesis